MRDSKIAIDHVEYHRALCCTPLPGDTVFGFVSVNHEISIHKANCLNADDLKSRPERIIKLGWPSANKGTEEKQHAVPLEVQADDHSSMLVDLTAVAAEHHINIRSLEARSADGSGDSLITMVIEVSDRGQLSRLRRGIKGLKGIKTVSHRGKGEEFREELFSENRPVDFERARPLITEVNRYLVQLAAEKPNLLRDLTPRLFEEFIAELFDGFGYEVELTAPSRDGGRDVVAICKHDDILLKYLVECKYFSPSIPVGVGYVRKLLGVKYDERPSKVILATTSFFTAPARDVEKRHIYELELRDYTGITQWIKRYKQLRTGVK
jgi:hypothetical protein